MDAQNSRHLLASTVPYSCTVKTPSLPSPPPPPIISGEDFSRLISSQFSPRDEEVSSSQSHAGLSLRLPNSPPPMVSASTNLTTSCQSSSVYPIPVKDLTGDLIMMQLKGIASWLKLKDEDVTRSKMEASSLKMECDKKNLELNYKDNLIVKLNQEKAKLVQDNVRVNKINDEVRKGLMVDNSLLQTEVAQLRSENAKRERSNDELILKQRYLEKALTDDEAVIEKLTTGYNKQEDTIFRLTKSNGELIEKIQNQNSKLETTNQRIHSLESAIKAEVEEKHRLSGGYRAFEAYVNDTMACSRKRISLLFESEKLEASSTITPEFCVNAMDNAEEMALEQTDSKEDLLKFKESSPFPILDPRLNKRQRMTE